jgi:hypothetical protein
MRSTNENVIGSLEIDVASSRGVASSATRALEEIVSMEGASFLNADRGGGVGVGGVHGRRFSEGW